MNGPDDRSADGSGSPDRRHQDARGGEGSATRPPSISPGRSLRLDRAALAYVVLRGEAQVFAVAPGGAAGQADGLRRPLGVAGPGCLLLGADPTGGSHSEALLATFAPGTELLPLDIDASWPPRELESPATASHAAEGWARLLAKGLGQDLGARPPLDAVLGPGRAVVAQHGSVLGAAQEGVWVDLGEAQASLFGMVPVSGLLPLPARAWLRLDAAGRVEGLGGPQAAERPGWVVALQALTAAALDMMPVLRGLAEADELNRLRLKQRLEAEAEAETRARMDRILGDRRVGGPSPAEAGDDDGLFHVLSLVSRAAGVALRRPERAREADLERLPDAAAIARASNLRLRRVRLQGRWWRHDLGSLLGRRAGAPVALLPGRAGYRVVDGTGREVALTAAVAAGLDGVAWSLVRPFPAEMPLGVLLSFGMQGSAADLGMLGLALLTGALLGQVVPIAVGLAFSLLIPAGEGAALRQLALGLAAAAALGYLIRTTQEVARQRIEIGAAGAAHAALWDRVLGLPLGVLRRYPVGELAARAAAAVGLPAAARGFAVMLAGSIAMLLSTAVTMLLHHPAAALLAFGITLAQVLAAVLAAWMQARALANGEALAGMADAVAFQLVSGVAKLRVAGAEERGARRWADSFATMRARSVAARTVAYGYDTFAAGSGLLGVAALYAVIALSDHGPDGASGMALSDVLAFLAAYAVHSQAAGALARGVLGAWMQIPTWRFARPLVQAQPEPAGGRTDPGRLSGAIEVVNVDFAYEGGGGPVFQRLAASIAAGEFVAVTGASGSGKTTLLRILLGLETPQAGGISYDGHDLRTLDLGALRRQIGTVLQHGRLPAGTILEAVRGLGDVDEAEIWRALHAAAVAQEIGAMPMGLRTMLTDASSTLSGGQVQRLLIARALVQRPSILLLDEATSALDAATEAAVSRALDGIAATRIVIAHRLSTIRRADRILFLASGRVAESGTYAELVATGGAFARMVAVS